MQRVLVISDNPAHCTAAQAALRLEGRAVRSEPTVERGLVAMREWQPGLVLLDLGTGLTAGGLAAFLRDRQVRDGVAVIAIVAPQQLQLVGAGVGVDDIVVPPLEEEELRVRVARALSLRAGDDDGSVLRRRSLVIDRERYTVTVDGEVVDLTFKEYELLSFLASNPGKPFHARGAVEPRLGLRLLRRVAHGGRPHPPHPRQDRAPRAVHRDAA